ncbi:MAG: hypothetical protein AAB503_01330 [Patescibacteria group bacterium]
MPKTTVSKAKQVEEILDNNRDIIPNFFRTVILNSFQEHEPTKFELDAVIKVLTDEIDKVKKYARG